MYKDKSKQKEAVRKAVARHRGVIPDPDVIPSEGAYVIPEEDTHVIPSTHPEKVQCGAIQRNWDDIPDWMQRSYMRSTHKWESMLVCVPDYTRPSILSTPNDIN